MMCLCAGPAAAHTSLAGSSPANGETVTSVRSIELRFAGVVMNDLADVVMTDKADRPIELSEPVVRSDTVTASIAGPEPEPGLYIISYRAVSIDGHPITGSLAFTLDPPGAQASTGQSSPVASSASSEATDDDDGALLAVGIGVVVLLLAGAGTWGYHRRLAVQGK
jgi:copper resistance protein C